jgi:N-methylhydantoinase A
VPDAARVPDRAVVDRAAARGATARRSVYFGRQHGWRDTPILARGDFAEAVAGPAIVEEYDATCVIPPDATARLDGYGNIMIELA